MTYSLEKKRLDLKLSWNISRNSSYFKENFFLTKQFQGYSLTSEIAPNIRYGETEETINDDFKRVGLGEKPLTHAFQNAVNNIEYKNHLIQKQTKIEKKAPIQTSISIPIMPIDLVKKYLEANKDFEILKIKLKGLETNELLSEVLKYAPSKKYRLDANESFHSLEEYQKLLGFIEHMNIEFIEQPFPADRVDLYKQIRPESKYILIADESIEDGFNPTEIKQCFHGVNLKLMKTGGIPKALELIQLAKENDLQLMLGCMIESSLGISEALFIADQFDFVDLDGSLLLKNDPYKDLLKLNKDKISLSADGRQLHEHVHGQLLRL